MNDFSKSVTLLLTIVCLVGPFRAEATAPRVGPQVFGTERKYDIVGYQMAPDNAAARSEVNVNLLSELAIQAFKAEGVSPTLDILPSRELAQYALANKDVPVLIGTRQDVPADGKDRYRVVVFYVRENAGREEHVGLIFDKNNERANSLYRAFNGGLRKILKNGEYLKILEKHGDTASDSTNVARRLKKYNPSWK